MTSPLFTIRLALGGQLSADTLCRLLADVASLGSLNQAAVKQRMSYRHAWGLVRDAEHALSLRLLIRRAGGRNGGGATLTDDAKRLLAQYRRFTAEVPTHVGGIFSSVDQNEPDAPARPVLTSSTIGPVETGLIPALEEAYLQQTGVTVRHIAAGTGQAIRIARSGSVDLVLGHAPSLEKAFIADGFGTRRYPLMSNVFVILGPPDDPANIRASTSGADAFRRIAASSSRFVSRGDQSGTHVKELDLWRAAGVPLPAQWHKTAPDGALGSLTTIRHAELLHAYTIVDQAAALTALQEGGTLAQLFTGTKDLSNQFSLIPVSPARFPHTNYDGAQQFVAWATGRVGQAIISDFGIKTYGQPLFIPARRIAAASTR
jgi:tungstate transport system substrate-binding protein